MKEKEKMLRGKLYNPKEKDLKKDRIRAQNLCKKLNEIDPYDNDKKAIILKKLFKTNKDCTIMPYFFCDYGYNIKFGKNFYVNHNCIILDANVISIGDNVLLGPSVQIYTSNHPIDVKSRISGKEYAKEIVIGNNVWVGGGAIICPGVKIGDNSVIAAGSVVTKNIEDNVVVGGNPAKLIRKLNNRRY